MKITTRIIVIIQMMMLVFGYFGPADANIELASQADALSGQVMIELKDLSYREGDVLSVVVKNGLQQTIWALNGKTACSTVALEQWTGTGWKYLAGCLMGPPAFPYPIKPGESDTIRIDPRSLNLTKLMVDSPLAFREGWYRVAFAYRLISSMTPEFNVPVVYSQVFRIYP